MARAEPAKKIGRPKKQINQKQFETLCAMQCTQQEICDVVEVTDKVLTAWCKETYGLSFSEVFSQKRNAGKASLRRMQWRLAEKNPAMAIFLGKNYLQQSDKQEVEHSGELKTTINIIPASKVKKDG